MWTPEIWTVCFTLNFYGNFLESGNLIRKTGVQFFSALHPEQGEKT